MRPRTWTPLLAALIGLAGASPATAGTFDVGVCGSGTAGPNTNNSWTLTTANASTLAIGCQAGAGLTARDVIPGPPNTPSGAHATWRFDAPVGTTVQHVRATYSRRLDDDWQPIARTADGTHFFGPCVGSCSTFSGFDTDGSPALNTPWVEVGTSCAGGGCLNGATLHSSLAAITQVRVEDPSAPTIGSPSGSLWTSGYAPASGAVSFAATDNTGIAQLRLYVDGVLHATDNRVCDYTFKVPCTNAPVTALNATLADGVHTLRATATDAAGNLAVGQTRSVTVDTAPPAAVPGLAASQVATGTQVNLSWNAPGGTQTAPLAAGNWQACPTTGGGCLTGATSSLNAATVTLPSYGSWVFRVWLTDGAGNSNPAAASSVAVTVSAPTPPPADPPVVVPVPTLDPAPPGLPPGTTPEPEAPSRTTTRPESARLDLHSLSRTGRKVRVAGNVSRKATAKLTVTATYKLRGKTRLTTRTVSPQGGRFGLTLTLPKGAMRQVKVTVRYPGSSRVASAVRTRTLRLR